MRYWLEKWLGTSYAVGKSQAQYLTGRLPAEWGRGGRQPPAPQAGRLLTHSAGWLVSETLS